MNVFYPRDGIDLYHGDCLSVMPALGVQFDTIITDPPYHLTQASRNGSPRKNDPATPYGRTRLGSGGFMGKTWDGGDVAFRPETWAACLEVCKPGAMLLAFGGTRTFHRLTCAIEDAGWEIRDCIMWVYGSGFPKSLDVSKAIDKAAGAERDRIRGVRSGVVGATYAQDAWSQEFKDSVLSDEPITDDAKKWRGWGTALKPAWEPIIVAMKPLDGTFAENAQRHGCAGLNIDECRIEGPKATGSGQPPLQFGGQNHRPFHDRVKANGRDGEASAERRYTESGGTNFAATPGPRGGSPAGRFPSNLILDGSDEVLAGFPQTTSNSTGRGMNRGIGYHSSASGSRIESRETDTGSAARFFYTAKASRSERGKTNTHPTVKPLALMRYLCCLTKTPTGGIVLDPFTGSGSTLIAAAMEGRQAVGIEMDAGHCEIIKDRLAERFPEKPEKPALRQRELLIA